MFWADGFEASDGWVHWLTVLPSDIVRQLDKFEEKRLTFYDKDVRLFRAALKLPDGHAEIEWARAYFLAVENQLFVLDGSSAPIHDTNEAGKVRLATPQDVAAYIELFCNFVAGDKGLFLLPPNLASIDAAESDDPLVPELPRAKKFRLSAQQTEGGEASADEAPEKTLGRIRQAAELNAQPPELSKEDDPKKRRWRAQRLFVYGGDAFKAELSVDQTGGVEMEDDEQLARKHEVRMVEITRAPREIFGETPVFMKMKPSGPAVPPTEVSPSSFLATQRTQSGGEAPSPGLAEAAPRGYRQKITGAPLWVKSDDAPEGLTVRDVVFQNPVLLDGLRTSGSVHFINCVFLQSIEVRECEFGGSFQLERCRVLGALDARGAHVKGDLSLRGSEIWGCRDRISTVVRLDEATVGGKLDFERSIIHGAISGRGCDVTGNAYFRGLRIAPVILPSDDESRPGFLCDVFGVTLDLRDARFRRSVDFGPAGLRDGDSGDATSRAEQAHRVGRFGRVSRRTTIIGGLDLSYARIDGAVRIGGMEVALLELYRYESAAASPREVVHSARSIAKTSNNYCLPPRDRYDTDVLPRALVLDYAQIGGNIENWGGESGGSDFATEIGARLSMQYATVGGFVDLRGAEIRGDVDAQGLVVGSGVFLSTFPASDNLGLSDLGWVLGEDDRNPPKDLLSEGWRGGRTDNRPFWVGGSLDFSNLKGGPVLSIRGAQICRTLRLSGAHFAEIDARPECLIKEKNALLKHSRFGQIVARGVRVDGAIRLWSVEIRPETNASSVGASTDLRRRADGDEVGDVDFQGAVLGGPLELCAPFSEQASKYSQDLLAGYFRSSFQPVSGVSGLLDVGRRAMESSARIAGALDLSGARISGFADLCNAEIDGDIRMIDTRVQGDVRAIAKYAEVLPRVDGPDCEPVHTTCAGADLRFLRCEGNVILTGLRQTPSKPGTSPERLEDRPFALSARNACLDGEFLLCSGESTEAGPRFRQRLDLRGLKAALVRIGGACVAEDRDSKVCIGLAGAKAAVLEVVAPPPTVELTDVEFKTWRFFKQGKENGKLSRTGDVADKLGFLKRNDPFSSSAYLNVSRELRDEARDEDAERIDEAMRSREGWVKFKSAPWRIGVGFVSLGWIKWLIWDVGTRYGAAPWRVLPVVVLSITFLWLGVLANPANIQPAPNRIVAAQAPSSGAEIQADANFRPDPGVHVWDTPDSWSLWDSAVFALDIAVPVVSLDPSMDWVPRRVYCAQSPPNGVHWNCEQTYWNVSFLGWNTKLNADFAARLVQLINWLLLPVVAIGLSGLFRKH